MPSNSTTPSSSSSKASKRPRPPAEAGVESMASTRRKRALDGMVLGPPNVYAEITPKPTLIHKTFILPRDHIDTSNSIMISDKLAYNQIAR
jgi:hypothetical protein